MKITIVKHVRTLMLCAGLLLGFSGNIAAQELALGLASSTTSILSTDKYQQMDLGQALEKLRTQKSVYLIFESNSVEGITVSQHLDLSRSVEEILTEWLTPSGLDFTRIDASTFSIFRKKEGNVRVKEIEQPSNELTIGKITNSTENSLEASVADVNLLIRDVSGVVRDAETNLPMEGVTVLVKGTTTGALTNQGGAFTISVPDDRDTLQFTYFGYTTLQMAIGDQTNLDVVMREDISTLDEVVVVGYGSQPKRDITAAISSVDAGAIERIPTSNSIDALKGQVAGVDIQQAGGRPGSTPNILIRGRRSISADNDPLFVVDGIPLTDGATVFDINPQDIESMEILKDAAATAIYGSRGANGVILITTKRGKEGRTTVTYNGYYGISETIRTIDMMDGQQFAELKRETRRDGFNGAIPPDEEVFEDPVEFESIALGRTTNYQDMLLDEGHQTNHQLSVTGGNAKTQFLVSFNYFQEQGVIPTQSFERYSVRVNLDHRITNFLKIGTSTFVTRSIQDFASNPMGEALANNPLGVPFDEEGNILFLPVNDGIRTNPLSEIVPGAYVDERKINRVFPSIFVELDVLDGLKLKSSFGPDLRTRRRGLFTASETNARRGAPPRARVENSEILGYVWENLATYDRSIGENHNFKFTALQSIQERRFESSFTDVNNLPYETQIFYNLGTAEQIQGVGSEFEKWTLASFMGRVNYDFKGRYLLQFSGRADGSSRLAPGNQWAFFPGISGGWRVIDEPFMQGLGFMNDLKLRASYGEVGNTSIDPYETQPLLQRTVYDWDGSPAFGYRLNQLANPELTWETTRTVDVGIDFGFFNGRLTGSVDYFNSNTEDLLLARQLPRSSGYGSVLENIGETKTTGLEIAINTVNFDTPSGFRWTTDLNWFTFDEEIVALATGDQDDVGNRWFIGEPINVFYDFEKIGIWQLNEEELAAQFGRVPGEIKLNDVNGNGSYDGEDRQILGSDVPDWSGGITNTFSYKGFDLSVFVIARIGHTIFSTLHTSGSRNGLFGRYNNLDVDYWTPNNPTNAFPRPNQNQESPTNASTLGYFDGSYTKIRNINLSYTFPNKVANAIKAQNLRLYFTVQNVAIFSDYDTYDPEINEDRDPGQTGDRVDAQVPVPRLYLMGLNVSF